jgi:hypothetical protein
MAEQSVTVCLRFSCSRSVHVEGPLPHRVGKLACPIDLNKDIGNLVPVNGQGISCREDRKSNGLLLACYHEYVMIRNDTAFTSRRRDYVMVM